MSRKWVFGIMLTLLSVSTLVLVSQPQPAVTVRNNRKILWDNAHGEEPYDHFSVFVNALENAGFQIDQFTTGPINSSVLQGYNVLVLVSPNMTFSTGERSAIFDFVQMGGGLLQFCVFSYACRDVANLISKNFGVTFVTDFVKDPTDYTHGDTSLPLIHEMKAHAITKGIYQFVVEESGTFQINAPAQKIAWGDEDAYSNMYPAGTYPPVLVVSRLGKGKATFIHDTDIFKIHEYQLINEYDNKRLGLNIVNWLATPSISILFDEMRAGPDTLHNEYSGVAQTLLEQGYDIDSTEIRLNSAFLAAYDLLIITCPFGSYTESELQAIEDFVYKGGGVLLMAQSQISDPTGLDQLSALFQIAFLGPGPIRDPDMGVDDLHPIITNFKSNHPVCFGLTNIMIHGGRCISIEADGVSLAWGDENTFADLNNSGEHDANEPIGSDLIVMAAVNYGRGKGVFISDTDIFDNDSILTRDHKKLLSNIIKWLDYGDSFDVTWGLGLGPYYIIVFCNHHVTSFSFNKTEKQLSFTITADNPDLCNITVPRNRLDSPFSLTIDDTSSSQTLKQNATHSSLSFTYTAGTHYIEITGTKRGYIVGDLNDDGAVDIFDIVIAAKNFGHKEGDYN